MNKILLILTVLSLAAINVSCGEGSQTRTLHQEYYFDNILNVYNNSCIETCNYLYMFINNTALNLDYFDEFDNRNIIVEELKPLGNKSILANVFIL